MKNYKEVGTCSICGNIYTHWGNNAQPINNGRCCDNCNYMKVFPARIDQMRMSQRSKK